MRKLSCKYIYISKLPLKHLQCCSEFASSANDKIELTVVLPLHFHYHVWRLKEDIQVYTFHFSLTIIHLNVKCIIFLKQASHWKRCRNKNFTN